MLLSLVKLEGNVFNRLLGTDMSFLNTTSQCISQICVMKFAIKAPLSCLYANIANFLNTFKENCYVCPWSSSLSHIWWLILLHEKSYIWC